tara:strand:+ start:7111 stop:7689 length:579 start_codon:yes stop_codon:yes gene_type:complete
LRFKNLVTIFLLTYFGTIFNAIAEYKKNCLFEICDGDKIKDIEEKRYRRQYFVYKFMYSKRMKFNGYDSEVAAYFKDQYSTVCDKSIRIYFDKWDKRMIEKLIKEIIPSVSFKEPLSEFAPTSRVFYFKVSANKELSDFIKYAKGSEQSMIRISLGPECVMIDKKNDYFRGKDNFENHEKFYKSLMNIRYIQ